MVGDGSKKVQGSILNGRFDFFFRIVIHISLFLFESGLSWGAQTPKLWPHNRRDLSSPVRNGAQGPLHQKVDS